MFLFAQELIKLLGPYLAKSSDSPDPVVSYVVFLLYYYICDKIKIAQFVQALQCKYAIH